MTIHIRTIVCCLALMLSVTAKANKSGDITEHEVERGETIESIARLYDVTPEEILKFNSLDAVFTGMILRVPQAVSRDEDTRGVSEDSFSATSNSRSTYSQLKGNNISFEEQKLVREAESAFKSKKYGKSSKLYGRLFKKYPKATYVYNRGLSHYNNNKYRQAANDIEKALSMPDVSASMKKNGPDILADARKRHEIWQQEQGQMWGSLLGAVVTAGANTWMAVENAKAQEKIAKSLASSSNERSYLSSSSSTSTSSSSSRSSSESKVSSNSKQKQKCGFCGGKGSIVKYVANYGIDKEPWCEECGKNVVSGHYHQTCTQCNGTGER